MAYKKEDERKPLSRAAVQKELSDNYKGLFIMDMILFLVFSLIGLIVAAIASTFWHLSVAVKIVCVLLYLPFWGCAVYFLLRGIFGRFLLRKDLQSELFCMEADEVVSKSAEMRQGRRYPIRVHLLDLRAYGTHSVSEAVWTVSSEGDVVYVAVLKREKVKVLGVYPAITYRWIDS